MREREGGRNGKRERERESQCMVITQGPVIEYVTNTQGEMG